MLVRIKKDKISLNCSIRCYVHSRYLDNPGKESLSKLIALFAELIFEENQFK